MNDNIKTKTERIYIDNNNEKKVNLTFNRMSQETAEKFVTEVNHWYNRNIINEIKKVG